MAEIDSRIEFGNLRENRKEIGARRQKFVNFSSFVLGLLLGAVIAIPVNLFLKPLAYRGDNLVYGPTTLWESAPWWTIPLFSILSLIVIISIIIIIYTIWIGLVGKEKVIIPYDESINEDIFTKLANFVNDEGESLGIQVKHGDESSSIIEKLSRGSLDESEEIPEGTDRIRCIDPYREITHTAFEISASIPPAFLPGYSILQKVYPKTVLEMQHKSAASEIHLYYDPNNSNSTRILDDLLEKFDG